MNDTLATNFEWMFVSLQCSITHFHPIIVISVYFSQHFFHSEDVQLVAIALISIRKFSSVLFAIKIPSHLRFVESGLWVNHFSIVVDFFMDC